MRSAPCAASTRAEANSSLSPRSERWIRCSCMTSSARAALTSGRSTRSGTACVRVSRVSSITWASLTSASSQAASRKALLVDGYSFPSAGRTNRASARSFLARLRASWIESSIPNRSGCSSTRFSFHTWERATLRTSSPSGFCRVEGRTPLPPPYVGTPWAVGRSLQPASDPPKICQARTDLATRLSTR